MVDADVNMVCDVLLFKIDVRAGYWGMYNFYKMQVTGTRKLCVLKPRCSCSITFIFVSFLTSTGVEEPA